MNKSQIKRQVSNKRMKRAATEELFSSRFFKTAKFEHTDKVLSFGTLNLVRDNDDSTNSMTQHSVSTIYHIYIYIFSIILIALI